MAIRWLKKGICAALGLTALLALAASAGATTMCTKSNPPTPGSSIDDNVLVPSGATCTLNNVTVTGNVTVESGGCLFADAAIIGGNVSATAAECLAIGFGSSIGGSVTALRTAGVPPDSPATGGKNYICATTIGGNVTIDNSGAEASWCIGSASSSPCQCLSAPNTNIIIGNLTFDNNKGSSEIANNYIGSNLNCSGNKNLTGSGNKATNKLGQCAGF